MKKILFAAIILIGCFTILSAQVEIGDASGNITEFELDGTMEFHGNATVYEDLRVALTAGKVGVANPPIFAQFRDNGSGSPGVYAYSFADESNATKEQQLMFTVQMPHAWSNGSTIYPHIHWSPGDNNSGAVVWGLEYTWIEYNSASPEQFTTTTIITTTSDPVSNSQYDHLLTSFPSITPNTSQDNISSILLMRIFRNSSNAADTYTGSAFGLSFDIHYEINTAGSRQEFIK